MSSSWAIDNASRFCSERAGALLYSRTQSRTRAQTKSWTRHATTFELVEAQDHVALRRRLKLAHFYNRVQRIHPLSTAPIDPGRQLLALRLHDRKDPSPKRLITTTFPMQLPSDTSDAIWGGEIFVSCVARGESTVALQLKEHQLHTSSLRDGRGIAPQF